MPSEAPQATLLSLVRALRAHLEYQRACGARAIPGGGHVSDAEERPAPAAAVERPVIPERAGPERVVRAAPVSGDLFAEPGLRRTSTLGELRDHIGDCQRCKLAPGRTKLVFGVGNPTASLLFVGEGPGRDEDLQGEPFVGRAGQLLTEIITKGMKLRRADVYIANVIKCRPPDNRNPEPDEIASCLPFLARQVELIGPKVIVALGTFAAQTLLDVRTPITQLRGVWHEYQGVKVMPTFHPAYLLRNPADKKLVWADIKQVMHALGMSA